MNNVNNILFFLTPKAMCAHLHAEDTLRQALERMEQAHYSALPILDRKGRYVGTLTEGDLLWAIKDMCGMDLRQTEDHKITDIAHRRDNIPVRVNTSMQDLIERAASQNFVPVVDDKNDFIGIITRRSIMKYCQEKLFSDD